MTAKTDLPPLPEGNVAHLIAAQAAEIEALRAEVSGLRAARIAYANEFPATEDGDPDTGNIHANIRALKARAERLRAEVERLRADRDSWEQQASDRVADWHAEHLRAERLAEALRELVDVFSKSGMYDEEVFAKARAALAKENSND